MNPSYSKNDKIIAIFEVIGALLVIGFWIGWFLNILKSFEPEHQLYDVYIAFESSFPVADTWIVILLLISAFGVLNEKSYGSFFAAAAGGAFVFLGLIDITFNLQQGVYQYDPSAIVINSAALIGGIVLLAWFGRYHFSTKLV
ncbi:MAG: hypothetical protein ACFFFH_08805 [Candidatus Thorarchaeota archaeon]